MIIVSFSKDKQKDTQSITNYELSITNKYKILIINKLKFYKIKRILPRFVLPRSVSTTYGY